MSNEVINPDQQFLDAAGNPLASGTVTFNVNETGTLATIYSDEALTVPQSNPYTLDSSGRISGDVKYTGKLRVISTTVGGATVRTWDNVITMGTSIVSAADLPLTIDGTTTNVSAYLNAKDVVDYAELRALDSSALPDGCSITVTDELIGGEFVIDTGAVTDNGDTLIVFTDDSNRYARRLYETLHAKWSGIGDGSDDYARLQAMIETNHAGENVDFNGLTLNIDFSSIPSSEGVLVKSGAILDGGNCTINCTGTDAGGSRLGSVFVIKDQTNIKIQNFRFVNTSDLLSSSSTKGAGNFVFLWPTSDRAVSDIEITGNYMERCYGSSIGFYQAAIITDNFISHKIIVTNNTFKEAGSHCCAFFFTHGGVFSNNSSYNHQGLDFGTLKVGNLIDVSDGCKSCVVDGNIEDGCIFGAKIQSTLPDVIGENITFSNNVFKNFSPDGAGSTRQYGINIAGFRCTVTGNVIEVGVDYATGVIMTDEVDGIGLAQYADKCVITGNVIVVNGAGIINRSSSGSEATSNTISGNTITVSGTQSGIENRDHYYTEIIGNQLFCEDTTGIPIWFAGKGSVSSNTVFGGTSTNAGALYIDDTVDGESADLIVCNNRFVGSASQAASLVFTTSSAVVDSLQFSGNSLVSKNGQHAALLRSASTMKPVISNNIISMDSPATTTRHCLNITAGVDGGVISGNHLTVTGVSSANNRCISITAEACVISANYMLAPLTCINFGTTDWLNFNGNIMEVASGTAHTGGTIGANSSNVNNLAK